MLCQLSQVGPRSGYHPLIVLDQRCAHLEESQRLNDQYHTPKTQAQQQFYIQSVSLGRIPANTMSGCQATFI